jgi:hypothetical protein
MLHMKYRTRIYYSETDKALMWERWRQGESLQAIDRAPSGSSRTWPPHPASGGTLLITAGS